MKIFMIFVITLSLFGVSFEEVMHPCYFSEKPPYKDVVIEVIREKELLGKVSIISQTQILFETKNEHLKKRFDYIENMIAKNGGLVQRVVHINFGKNFDFSKLKGNPYLIITNINKSCFVPFLMSEIQQPLDSYVKYNDTLGELNITAYDSKTRAEIKLEDYKKRQ